MMGLIMAAGGTARANWSETFGADGTTTDQVWLYGAYPGGTFQHSLTDAGGGDYYLNLREDTGRDAGGAQIGAALCVNEVFGDVRVGATININGNDRRHFLGLVARADAQDIPGVGVVVKAAYPRQPLGSGWTRTTALEHS